MAEQILFKCLRGDAQISKAYEGDAGFDLHWCPSDVYTKHIEFDHTADLETGIAVAIPYGYVGLVFSRSGMGFKSDVRLANCVGVIDAGYRGELRVKLTADGAPHSVNKGDKIAQLVVVPFHADAIWVEELPSSERNIKGFGSSS